MSVLFATDAYTVIAGIFLGNGQIGVAVSPTGPGVADVYVANNALRHACRAIAHAAGVDPIRAVASAGCGELIHPMNQRDVSACGRSGLENYCEKA